MTQNPKPLTIDLRFLGASEKLISQSAILTSHQARWDNIHLLYHRLPHAEVPESCHPTHTIALGLGATVRRERWVDDCYQQI